MPDPTFALALFALALFSTVYAMPARVSRAMAAYHRTRGVSFGGSRREAAAILREGDAIAASMAGTEPDPEPGDAYEFYTVEGRRENWPGDPDMISEEYASESDALAAARSLARAESDAIATDMAAWCDGDGGHLEAVVVGHWTDPEDGLAMSEDIEHIPATCPVCDTSEGEAVLFLRHPNATDEVVFALFPALQETDAYGLREFPVYAEVGEHSFATFDYLKECEPVTDPRVYAHLRRLVAGRYESIRVVTETPFPGPFPEGCKPFVEPRECGQLGQEGSPPKGCTEPADGYLLAPPKPDGTRIAFPICQRCGEECAATYREKLGELWAFDAGETWTDPGTLNTIRYPSPVEGVTRILYG